MAMAARTTGGTARVQAEAWEAGGARHALVVTQGRRGARAALMRVGVRSRLWEVALAAVPPVATHHGREALLARLAPSLAPAGNAWCGWLGFRGGAPSLHDMLCGTVVEGWPEDGAAHRHGANAVGKSTLLGDVLRRFERFGRRRAGRAHACRPGDWGFPVHDSVIVARLSGGAHGPVEGDGPEPAGTVRFGEGAAVEAYAAVEGAVAAALSFLRVPLDAEAAALLGPENWTAEAHAWLSDPGEAGGRRRQAASLYPALAPLVASRPGIGLRVDAGRPYEDELLEAAREALGPSFGEGLTAAHLRRLRTLPRSVGFDGLADALDAAARLPVDWLPSDAAGWAAMASALSGIMPHVHEMGLDLRALLGGRPDGWKRPAGAAADAGVEAAFALQPVEAGRHRAAMRGRDPALVALDGAEDACRKLADTLVGPTLRSMDAAGEAAWPEGADAYAVSARLLLGGRTLAAVDRVQARWHEGLPRMDGLLPCAGTNAWPRAFPDFMASNGLAVACLADEAALKAEGMRGPDADGVEGLDHCVGSYGRRCHSGDCQVASVRRPDGTRVSTAAFEMFLADDGPHLHAFEHLALRNEDPPPEAEAAVRELAAAVRAGRHPVDIAAFAPRDPAGFVDGYDWRDAGALDRAFAAWGPHLPRAVARGGMAALRGWLAREVGAGHPRTPRGRDGFSLEDPVDVRGGPQ